MFEALDRAALKRRARELLQTAQVSPKGMTALYCSLTLLMSVLDYLAGSAISFSGAPTSGLELFRTFVTIFTTLAGWILVAGFTIYCMGIRQRDEMGYGTLFDGFSFTGKVITLNCTVNLLILLWSMLFVFPGFIAYYRYRFAYYNLYENPGLNILEALEMSKRQTKGMKLELFKLDMSYLGWALLSILPALVVDLRLYCEIISDPAALLTTAGASLPEVLLTGVWSLLVSLFYLPNYQCVSLDYFESAKANTTGRPAFPGNGPDGLF